MANKLETAISCISYIYDALKDYSKIISSGNCNDCEKMFRCEYAPKPGQLVRYNCPFYKKW